MGSMKTPGVYIIEKNAFPNSVVEAPTAEQEVDANFSGDGKRRLFRLLLTIVPVPAMNVAS